MKFIVRIIRENETLNHALKRFAMVFPVLSNSLLRIYRENGPIYEPVINHEIADEELKWFKGSYYETENIPSERYVCNVFFDFSAIVDTSFTTGIQRVTKSLFDSTKDLYIEQRKVSVEAIYSELNSYLFYKCKLSGEGKYIKNIERVPEDVVQFKREDVLLLTDTNFDHIAAKKQIYMSLLAQGVRIYAVLYDLIPIEYPEFFSKEIVYYFKQYLRTISELSGVIAISKTSLRGYEKWIESNGIVNERLYKDFFYLGCDFDRKVDSRDIDDIDTELLNKLNSNITFLMVGTIEPRKCHKEVLDAFELLWKSGKELNLVFVGKYGWHMEEIVKRLHKHKENGKHFFWLQGISDGYLAKIYENCDVVIQASVQEGFGLPLIEATHYRKPIIARDIPVFREIMGDNAYYFVDDSPEQLSRTIISWLDIQESGKMPVPDRIEIMSWKKAAEELMNQIFVKSKEGCVL